METLHAKVSKGPFDVDRTIPLRPVAADILDMAVQKMRAMDSVIDVHIDRRGHLRVRYDASSMGIRDIEQLLDEAEVGRSPGPWWRFKSAFYRFLDGNARTNALSRGGACCNQPPTLWNGERNVDRKD